MLKTYLGIVILITVVAGIGCKRETSPAVDPRKKPLESLEDHLEERNALDEDVWKQEKLAQFYEQRSSSCGMNSGNHPINWKSSPRCR